MDPLVFKLLKTSISKTQKHTQERGVPCCHVPPAHTAASQTCAGLAPPQAPVPWAADRCPVTPGVWHQVRVLAAGLLGALGTGLRLGQVGVEQGSRFKASMCSHGPQSADPSDLPFPSPEKVSTSPCYCSCRLAQAVPLTSPPVAPWRQLHLWSESLAGRVPVLPVAHGGHVTTFPPRLYRQ